MTDSYGMWEWKIPYDQMKALWLAAEGRVAPKKRVRTRAMFGIAAVILFAIAAFVAFAGGSVSVIGLIALGLACLAAHLLYPVTPWRRVP